MLRSHAQKQPISFLAAALLLGGGIALNASSVSAVTFSTPDGTKGTPQQETTGGATRNGGQCSVEGSASQEAATALIPNSKQGLTVAERPTFFVFVPPTTAKEASFSLKDESENLVYQTKVALPSQGGVIGVSLPATSKALEVEKNYQWMLEIHCAAEFDPDNPLVQGWVRRTEMTAGLSSQIEKANTSLERAAVYGEAGIWYEAVRELFTARQSQPQDSNLEKNWQELLTSAGLQAIATKPLTR